MSLAASVSSSEITVIRSDKDSIIFDLPFGMPDLSRMSEGCYIPKPNSILECKYLAIERIGIADSPKLLARLSAEERIEKIAVNTLKRSFIHELGEFSRSLPEIDDPTKHSAELTEAFKELDKVRGAIFLADLKRILSQSEALQRKEHREKGALESFDEYIATIKKLVLQIERFISTSSEANLFDDLYYRSMYQHHLIFKRHVLPLVKGDFAVKLESVIAEKGIEQEAKSLMGRTGIESHLLDMAFYEKLGMVISNRFVDIAAEEASKIDHIRSLVAGSLHATGVVDELLSVLGISPSSSISDLVGFLKTNGPFAAHGWYGKSQYLTPPQLYASLSKLGERDVFAWKPGAQRADKSSFAHCVTVVGAMATSDVKGIVFFVDPIEGSDPSDHTTEKVYAISYDNFKKNHIQIVFTPKLGVEARV
jgi:hypothetical protein